MIPFRPKAKSRSLRSRRWEMLAWLAALFSSLVAVVLLVIHLDTPTLDPLKSAELKNFKVRLRDNPADEGMKQKIRELDLRLRRQYFQLQKNQARSCFCVLAWAVVCE